MRIRYGVIMGLIILAVLSLAGTGAAEETPASVNLTDGRPLPPPSPDQQMAAGLNMTAGNRTGWRGMPGGIPPYNGTIDATSPLYGLKIAFENLDESFTFNETERVEKQVGHGQNRLAELMQELALNRTGSAEGVLHQYREKMNQTERSLAGFGGNGTGLLHAQEMIAKHQSVLEGLLAGHPGNRGLATAVNNSEQVQARFEERTQVRFQQDERAGTPGSMKMVRLEKNERQQSGTAGNGQQAGQNARGGQNDDQQTPGQPDQGGQNSQNAQVGQSGDRQNPGQGSQDGNQQQNPGQQGRTAPVTPQHQNSPGGQGNAQKSPDQNPAGGNQQQAPGNGGRNR